MYNTFINYTFLLQYSLLSYDFTNSYNFVNVLLAASKKSCAPGRESDIL